MKAKQRALAGLVVGATVGLVTSLAGAAPSVASTVPLQRAVAQQEVQASRTVTAATGGTVVAYAQSGDGVIRITTRVCGNANNWPAVAAANNIKASSTPPYLVLLNQAVRVSCAASAPVTPQQVPQTRTQSTVTSASWVHPVPGACDRTNEYLEMRYNPITHKWYHHQGIDIPRSTGTPIHAIGAGKVISAHDIGRGGLQVQIQHANGVVSKYNHLSRFATHVGQQVAVNQVIGYVGSTGDATGPHLHLEVWVYGSMNDPSAWLRARGVRILC